MMLIQHAVVFCIIARMGCFVLLRHSGVGFINIISHYSSLQCYCRRLNHNEQF